MPKRILLVEDDENNAALMGDLLATMLGHEVVVAGDGAEAIRLAHEHLPDLILLDLNLPKLSGWEAARSLKASEACRHIPILAVTAHSMLGDREHALEAGCDDYYAKPVDVDAFIAFLEPYLSD
jgi:two-component system cell cycle response regulator DivK